MTDQTTAAPAADAPPSAEDGPDFVVTPTLRAFTEVVHRVEHLEASQPALGDDTDDQTLSDRLDRHRSELEAIKVTLNAVIRFLGAPTPQLPAAPVATPAAAPAAGVTA